MLLYFTYVFIFMCHTSAFIDFISGFGGQSNIFCGNPSLL